MKTRPRVSLRTLFVLVAIASVPMGWVAYQLNWIRQRHEFILSQVHQWFSKPYDPSERRHRGHCRYLVKNLVPAASW